METTERIHLNELMARLAAGDNTALLELHAHFGGHLAATMRRHLRALNATQPAADELGELVLDGWLALRECCGSWDADGGALPWTWAFHRLRGVAARFVGQYADELDECGLTSTAAGPVVEISDGERELTLVLDDLAEADELVALFREALHLVASPRDRVVLLEVSVQEAMGDPSPARTVASAMGMTPEAVRKARSRVRSRLRGLAVADERFAGLPTLDPAA